MKYVHTLFFWPSQLMPDLYERHATYNRITEIKEDISLFTIDNC